MPPKSRKNFVQPKIKGYTKKLRSRSKSAPGEMADIEEETFSELEELPEDAGIQELVLKMNEVCRKVDKIERILLNEDTGLKRRLPEVELKAETNGGKLLVMSKEYKAIKQDLSTIKGTIHRQYNQLNALDGKVVDLTARSMAQNFVITGILEERNENTKQKVAAFLTQELGLSLTEKLKIKVAHRIGTKRQNFDRVMVVKVNQALKDEILENIQQLEGRRNVKGNNFYMNVQQPEARIEAKRNAKALLKKFQKSHKDATVEIKGDKVYVNNEWQRPPVRSPTPRDTFYDPGEQKEMNKLKIIYTPPKDAGLCTFWGAAIRASNTLEVQRAYNRIRQEHSDLDHISVGYVADHNGVMTSGLADDKEYGAGFRILRQIREAKEEGIAIFVARRFGGVHLGTVRYENIEQAAKRALQQINAVSPPRSSQQTIPKETPTPFDLQPRLDVNQLLHGPPTREAFKPLPNISGSASPT